MDFTSYFDYPDSAPGKRDDVLVFLAQACPADWARLLEHTETRRFAAGEFLVRRGTTEQVLFIVGRGRLEVLVDGRRIAAIEQGSVFGEQSFFDGQPRSADGRALSGGEIRCVTPASFEVLAARRRVRPGAHSVYSLASEHSKIPRAGGFGA
ncbi:MAG TPA: cyclic nucleotide-binding domain-containing protein [Burkholderiales bacterium]|nr:cyclic nucleotide-binding domain-containing protein [Burkholderiales bacterium]